MLKKILNLIYKVLNDRNIFFIGSADKLPAPLTKEEEEYYIEEHLKGN